jgi:hypothetical protein
VTHAIDEDELIGNWTLAGAELEQVAGRRGPAKLAFALLLKFYVLPGRFPAWRGELPDDAAGYVARLVGVPAADLAFYEWDRRTIKAHRAAIRKFLGFRECTVADAGKATGLDTTERPVAIAGRGPLGYRRRPFGVTGLRGGRMEDLPRA